MSSGLSSKLKKSQKPPEMREGEFQKAPLFRRLAAYVIDWFVGDLMAAFPVVMIYALTTGSTEVISRLEKVPEGFGILAGILSLVCVFLGFVIIPWKLWRGQTVGKRLCGICILRTDGTFPGLRELIIRQILGLIILENGLLTVGRYLTELLQLISGGQWNFVWWNRCGAVLGIISCLVVVVTPSGRAIHDFVAGTRVVSLKTKIK